MSDVESTHTSSFEPDDEIPVATQGPLDFVPQRNDPPALDNEVKPGRMSPANDITANFPRITVFTASTSRVAPGITSYGREK